MTATANRTDADEADLPPLYDYVDMDAVRSLVHHGTGERGATTRVEFAYAGCRVAVDGDGAVTVTTDDEDDGAPLDSDDDRTNPRISG